MIGGLEVSMGPVATSSPFDCHAAAGAFKSAARDAMPVESQDVVLMSMGIPSTLHTGPRQLFAWVSQRFVERLPHPHSEWFRGAMFVLRRYLWCL